VWRLRSAARTAHGSTSDWFGPHPDGLLIFTDDLHFTEAVTRTDLRPAASGDRLSTTPQENRALAQGTLGSYGTYTAGDDGSLAAQHILGSTSRTGTTPPAAPTTSTSPCATACSGRPSGSATTTPRAHLGIRRHRGRPGDRQPGRRGMAA
jgi:hypothetical protein